MFRLIASIVAVLTATSSAVGAAPHAAAIEPNAPVTASSMNRRRFTLLGIKASLMCDSQDGGRSPSPSNRSTRLPTGAATDPPVVVIVPRLWDKRCRPGYSSPALDFSSPSFLTAGRCPTKMATPARAPRAITGQGSFANHRMGPMAHAASAVVR